jgi:signal transduction histidine kinase
VDPDRITEIVDQLLNNALHHCRSGDTVTVTVTPVERDSHSVRAGVRVVVTDTGSGFDPRPADALFTRFYRAAGSGGGQTPDTGGSGVGLTIARSLAQAHRGTLTAASPGPGRGATFVLTIPA